ncbi:glycosyltransferase [Cobetia marina]|uniref:Glycosyltransferase n=1 Tax=Cobetia marina TaxID=28258 RepID=A0ABU9GBM2_COBMA
MIVTNMFPSKGSQKGVFVKESVESIRDNFPDVSIDILNIDEYRDFRGLKYFFSVFPLFFSLIRNSPNVVHVHYGLSLIPTLLLLPLFLLKKIPIIITYHGSDLMGHKLVNIISNLGALMCSKVILVSDKMEEFLWTCSRNKISIIPCGVNSNLFGYVFREEKETQLKPFKVIFPSSPHRIEKNYVLFSEIMLELKKNGITVQEIIFDNMSREEILDSYAKSDLLLLTSSREGSPQVIKEALFTGLPVVSTDVGDVKSVLAGLDNTFVSNRKSDIVNWIATSKKSRSIPYDQVLSKMDLYSDISISRKVVNIYFDMVAGK